LFTDPLLENQEKLPALVRPKNVFVLQEVVYDHLLHGLLLGADFFQSGVYSCAIGRLRGDRVNEFGMQPNDAVPDAVYIGEEPISARHHPAPLVLVQLQFLVGKCLPGRDRPICVSCEESQIEHNREDDGERSYGPFHRDESP
jgi:hypothetical protein